MPTTVAPTTETGVFAGSEDDVSWTVTMPAGWENSGWGVVKGDPLFGFVTAEVGNIYADPCQWELVAPFGPTVDDLVAAWANVPGFDATSTRDVTVDGYAGMHIEFTVPNYNEDQCTDGRYGIWQEAIGIGDGPNYWAQGPNQHILQRHCGQLEPVEAHEVDAVLTEPVVGAHRPPAGADRDG